MFKMILVPLDGADVAEGILPYVSQIAKETGVPLLLLTVMDPDAMTVSKTEAINADRIEATVRAHVLSGLNGIADQLRKESIEARVEVTVGRPADEILRFADETGCDLIAMSTHGRSAMGRGILGSVTDKVVHSADVPVLTVRPETAKTHQGAEGLALTKVILPLDGSQLAEQAVPYVENLAQEVSLEVVLVQVVSTTHSAYAYPEFAANLPDFIEELVGRATENLSSVALSLRAKGLTVQTQVLRGATAPALVDFAQQTPQSIIAMTTRGRSGLTR